MDLYGLFPASEGGGRPDVHHGLVSLLADRCRSGIDAVTGDELARGLEVRRWKTHLLAYLLTRDHAALYRVGSAEKGGGQLDLAGGDELAYPGAADHGAALFVRRDRADREAELVPEPFEVLYSPRAPPAEGKPLSHPDLSDAEVLYEDLFGELPRVLAGELPGEPGEYEKIHAEGLYEA